MKEFFKKNYHQQAASLNDSDQNIEFIFGENINYYQIGIAYLHYELTEEKVVAVATSRAVENGDCIKLLNNAFAYRFKESGLRTTGGSDIEHNKKCRQISTIMGALTNKDGDLLTDFYKIENQKLK